MRILVIGGTGFIGLAATRLLAQRGYEVIVFHRGQTEGDLPPGVKHIHTPALSIEDRHELAVYGRSFFADLAPDVVLDMLLMTRAAAQTTLDVLRWIAPRIVVVSSQDVYAAYGRLLRLEQGPALVSPLSEDAPLRSHLYSYRGVSPRKTDDPQRWVDEYDKILVESIISQDPDLPSTVLRLPMVYGPGDRQHRLFEYLGRMDDHRPFILLEEGLAEWRTTRGYVDDVARGIALAVTDERAAEKIYNIGEAESLRERDWVQAIAEAAGWEGEIATLPTEALPDTLRPDFDVTQHLVTDSSRVREELGYHETIAREEALRRTVAWERLNPPRKTSPMESIYAAEDAAWAAWMQKRV